VVPVFQRSLEVAAGIGLLISRYASYAAVLLAIVMVGAIITHVTVLISSPAAAVVLFVLTGDDRLFTKALNITSKGPSYDRYFCNRRQHASGPVF